MMRELCLGTPYFKKKRLLKKTEFWTKTQLDTESQALLDQLLFTAGKSAFYQSYLSHGNKCESDPLVKIAKLPIIDKPLIRKNLNAFCVNTGWRSLKATTGGTTGQPFIFYMDRLTTRQMEKAFIFDQWSRVGYRMGDSIFNLRGRTPGKVRFVHHDPLFNIYYASSFELKKDMLGRYINSIDSIKPAYLHGYPSTMYQLASLMEASGKRLSLIPRAVFCGSEKLFPYQRDLIERIFQCRVYSWYGHSECLALGGECEYSQVFHFYPQYGYTELLPTGTKNASGKEIYAIVATGFNNTVMPIIRYHTGDYAVLADNQQCQCGRNYLLIEEVLGREQEFIVDNAHELISATSLIFGQHFSIFSGLDGIHLKQKTPGKLTIVMKKNSGFQPDDLESMKVIICNLLGDRFDISYEFADDLPRSPIGKARLVDQHIDIHRLMNSWNDLPLACHDVPAY